MKYNKLGLIIKVDLISDYEVIGIIDRINHDCNDFHIKLLLNRKDIGLWDEMNCETYTINNSNNIYMDTYNMIKNMLRNEDFFEYYINEYEYMLDLMDIGADIEERNN